MSFLAPRQLAAKQFNEKYGLTGDKAVQVKIRSDLDNVIKRAMSSVIDEYVNDEVKEETLKQISGTNNEVKDNG